jgi:hypothetical protein
MPRPPPGRDSRDGAEGEVRARARPPTPRAKGGYGAYRKIVGAENP